VATLQKYFGSFVVPQHKLQYGWQVVCDTALETTQGVVQQRMSSILSQLTYWIKEQLNVSKHSVMWFQSRSKILSSRPEIYIDGINLQMAYSQRYLDNTLQWKEHVSSICRKKCPIPYFGYNLLCGIPIQLMISKC